VKVNPALGEETISVLLFPYENRSRTQQRFSDLNGTAVETSKSLDVLFDHRDIISRVTTAVIDLGPPSRTRLRSITPASLQEQEAEV
jgi:DNA sulfur modification protein DndB